MFHQESQSQDMHEGCVPKPQFTDLMKQYRNIVEELKRVKSQLKRQEEAFRDLQMELANDKEVKNITEEIQLHQTS